MNPVTDAEILQILLIDLCGGSDYPTCAGPGAAGEARRAVMVIAVEGSARYF